MADDRGHRWLLEGYRLHTRGGRVAAAERAYRTAITAGRIDAWLYVGLLHQPRPGREHEAKAAFRTAMSHEDPGVSSRAAVELGGMLYRLDGDRAGARESFAFAAEHGSGPVWQAATIDLAHILAAEGDRGGAKAAFRSIAERRLAAAGVEDSETSRRIADAFTTLARRERSRCVLSGVGLAFYRARRIRRRLFPSGGHARLTRRR